MSELAILHQPRIFPARSAFIITYVEGHDDELRKFEASGAAPLPVTGDLGYIENDGARIWYSAYGVGAPVILLHGGLGHSGNWGYQVPTLIANGYRAVVIDSRGHGRSTRDEQPYSYELMASDVLAVMNALHFDRAAMVGWSDGACTALILAAKHPSRVAGVFFFACNCDSHGSRIANPDSSFLFDEPIKKSGSECTSDVRDTLAPIEAGVGEAAPRTIGDFQINTH